MPAPDLLVPTLADLAGWAGTLFAAAVMVGLGRLVTAGGARAEAALVAGWGIVAFVLTLWGVATPWSMRGPGVLLAVLGLAVLVLPRFRLARADWVALGRIAALALPLFAVMASARPAEPDTFLNLLPDAAYVYDHAAFPAAGRPIDYSYLPTAPYSLQLAAFVAGLATPGFPLNGLIAFNLVLQLAAALLLARLVAGGEHEAAPSWGACALGLMGATLLNPGFVPRYDLSSYSEPGVTVALAFAAWFAIRAIETLAARDLVLFAATLAALVNVKQDSVALAVALTAVASVLAVFSPSRWRGMAVLLAASLPAALLYLAWRWYVLSHLPQGELHLLPRALWQPGAVGLILASMARIVANKGVFYAALALVVGLSAVRLRRAAGDAGARLGTLLGGIFLLYSVALVGAYVVLFPGAMGSDAHSYFRYCTHLSLLLMASAALLVRGRRLQTTLARPAAAGVLIVAMAVSPVVFLRLVRFDLEPPDLRVWQLAAAAAPYLSDGERVALLLPGDNGSVAAMLGTVLRTAPPRRPNLQLDVVTSLPPGALDRLTAEGFRHAIVSCAPSGFVPAPQGSAAILVHDNEFDWRAEEVFRYPPPPPGRWSHVLSYAALCLP